MVIPRSRSRSMLSRNWAFSSRALTVPVSPRRRSASVDFPWSMWAMIEKFRMCLLASDTGDGLLTRALARRGVFLDGPRATRNPGGGAFRRSQWGISPARKPGKYQHLVLDLLLHHYRLWCRLDTPEGLARLRSTSAEPCERSVGAATRRQYGLSGWWGMGGVSGVGGSAWRR